MKESFLTNVGDSSSSEIPDNEGLANGINKQDISTNINDPEKSLDILS